VNRDPDAGLPLSATAEIVTSNPDRCSAISVSRDVGVPMRDGVRLSANLFRPDTSGALPVVLIRLPYGKDEHPGMWARGKYWARKGYACVVQDVRGKFGSEGEWQPFVNEAADGYDTLDWIAAQPWCGGAIGMTGESYMGMTQWAVAALGHPALRCMSPGNSTPDPYLVHYRSGALTLPFVLWACMLEGRGVGDASRFDPWHLPLATMDQSMGIASRHLRDVLAHPRRDAFWAPIDWRRAPATPRIPTLHWGGWYDVMLNGTLEGWSASAAGLDDPEDRGDQWLVVGPTDHMLIPAAGGGEAAAPPSVGAWSFDRVQRFFDHWLRDEDNGLRESTRVSVFMMGAERWLDLPHWPPPAARFVRYYLHGCGAARGGGSGRLDLEAPGDEPADHYDYDPCRPIDTWLGEDLWSLGWTLRDRGPVEERADVLLYTSEALDRGLEVVGPVDVTLHAASSAPDTDFAAALVDVFPNGDTCLVQEGIVRARYRDPTLGERLLSPGAVEEYSIDLWATAYRFAPGHRLRVEIASSIFGRYDRNLNSGRPFATDSDAEVAHQTVFHCAPYASHITLPVMPSDEECATS
jgi:putative CocE/NonD family hydrolase